MKKSEILSMITEEYRLLTEAKPKRGDYVYDKRHKEMGLINVVRGRAAYVKYPSTGSKSFDPVFTGDLKLDTKKHKGKSIWLAEGKLNEKYTGNPGDKLTHKHNKAISIELISPTNKGWKVYQIEKGKRKITHFNKQDITGPKAIFEGKLNEKAPPGMEKVVKALKKKKGVDNPYAVAWAMYNKKNEGKLNEASASSKFYDQYDKYSKAMDAISKIIKKHSPTAAHSFKYARKNLEIIFDEMEIVEGKLTEAEYGTPTGTKTLKSINAKFDDAVFKVPPHRIDKAWVLKVAKKYKVDPKKAIEWVNLNPKINIKEGKLNERGGFDPYVIIDPRGNVDGKATKLQAISHVRKKKGWFAVPDKPKVIKMARKLVSTMMGSKLDDAMFDLRFEGKLNEELRPDELKKLATDLAHSMPRHTVYDHDKGPSDALILAAMKKYQRNLFQYSTTSQKKQAVKIVKKVLGEGKLTEAKIKKGDAIQMQDGEFGVVNKVSGRVAYIKLDSMPGKFHPIEAARITYKGKHKGKDLYSEGKLNEGKYDYLVGSWIDIIKQPKRIFHIIKIEDDRFVHVKDQRENTSMFGIDTVKKSNPKLFKKKQRAAAWNKGQKTISQSKYQSILKGAMKDMKGEGYEEFTHDVAESMILDASLVKRLTKDYPTLNISQLTQRLQWDLENYI